jgi:hypothetical protein
MRTTLSFCAVMLVVAKRGCTNGQAAMAACTYGVA